LEGGGLGESTKRERKKEELFPRNFTVHTKARMDHTRNESIFEPKKKARIRGRKKGEDWGNWERERRIIHTKKTMNNSVEGGHEKTRLSKLWGRHTVLKGMKKKTPSREREGDLKKRKDLLNKSEHSVF